MHLFLLAILLLTAAALPTDWRKTLFASGGSGGDPFSPIQPGMFDISGMSYLGGVIPGGDGKFLAVHDAKPKEDADYPPAYSRVSIIRAPMAEATTNGVTHFELKGLYFPPPTGIKTGGQSTDLESVARIPGTDLVLLCESGNSGDDPCNADEPDKTNAVGPKTEPDFCETPPPRIYVAKVVSAGMGTEPPSAKIIQAILWTSFYKGWPGNGQNVEATAVAMYGDGEYIFLWAERVANSGLKNASNPQTATIHWTRLEMAGDDVSMSTDSYSADFTTPPDVVTGLKINRPIVSLDVDMVAETPGLYGIYAAAAADPLPESDFGPYTSTVFKIGQVGGASSSGPMPVEIFAAPQMLTQVQGFKVETVARASKLPGDMYGTDDPEEGPSPPMTFVGTDDENYGGTLRPLNLAPIERDEL